ncbi:MAG: class I SAM-dependent methyltransferase [Melioribacteraceae bacterium]|nr:class I SAM-dependent methyltransferase [Melioribacteraceae bacterium]
MKEAWDERFAHDEYFYGTEPTPFFKEILEELTAGKILLLGEGEGKNSVFAAQKGWETDAIDFSEEAKKKALKLAGENNVTINYHVEDLSHYVPKTDYFDAVGLFYLHVGEELRIKIHKNVMNSLKIGGTVILQCFSEDQLKYNSGGPKKLDYLYTLEQIYTDFQDLDLIKFEKVEIELNEGNHHKGVASVIKFVGRKV